MKVLLLVGGLGLRLRSVVADRPKPMALFQQKPFLEYQLRQLRSQGFTHVILCAGYRAEQIRAYWGSGQTLDLTIDYVVEHELLGTAGAIKNAAALIKEPFLVLNGDSFLNMDFRHLIDCHHRCRQHGAAPLATLVAVPVEEASAYGTLQLTEEGRVERFVEKGVTGPGWVNGGAYLFEPEVLTYIPAQQVVSLEQTTFPLLLAAGHQLYAYRFHGFFVDIGTPSGHQRFTHFVETAESVYGNL